MEDAEGGGSWQCSICLKEGLPISAKAVLEPCLHDSFCYACVDRWLRVKTACPICKGQTTSFIYNIKSLSTYNRRYLQTVCGQAKQLQNIADEVPNPLVTATAAQSVSHPTPQRSAQPRPYTQRLQRLLQSQATRHQQPAATQPLPQPTPTTQHPPPQHPTSTNSHSPSPPPTQNPQGASPPRGSASLTRTPLLRVRARDTSAAWRASIYHKKHWARPLSIDLASTANIAAKTLHSRMPKWLTRELTALTGSAAAELLVPYVKELVRKYGLQHSFSHVAQGGVASAQGGSGDPVTALLPYLRTRAKHFWHEVRCFGLAPFAMEVYDQVVIYDKSRRGEPLVRAQEECRTDHTCTGGSCSCQMSTRVEESGEGTRQHQNTQPTARDGACSASLNLTCCPAKESADDLAQIEGEVGADGVQQTTFAAGWDSTWVVGQHAMGNKGRGSLRHPGPQSPCATAPQTQSATTQLDRTSGGQQCYYNGGQYEPGDGQRQISSTRVHKSIRSHRDDPVPQENWVTDSMVDSAHDEVHHNSQIVDLSENRESRQVDGIRLWPQNSSKAVDSRHFETLPPEEVPESRQFRDAKCLDERNNGHMRPRSSHERKSKRKERSGRKRSLQSKPDEGVRRSRGLSRDLCGVKRCRLSFVERDVCPETEGQRTTSRFAGAIKKQRGYIDRSASACEEDDWLGSVSPQACSGEGRWRGDDTRGKSSRGGKSRGGLSRGRDSSDGNSCGGDSRGGDSRGGQTSGEEICAVGQYSRQARFVATHNGALRNGEARGGEARGDRCGGASRVENSNGKDNHRDAFVASGFQAQGSPMSKTKRRRDSVSCSQRPSVLDSEQHKRQHNAQWRQEDCASGQLGVGEQVSRCKDSCSGGEDKSQIPDSRTEDWPAALLALRQRCREQFRARKLAREAATAE